jgi:hypothetical protein
LHKYSIITAIDCYKGFGYSFSLWDFQVIIKIKSPVFIFQPYPKIDSYTLLFKVDIMYACNKNAYANGIGFVSCAFVLKQTNEKIKKKVF